MAALQRTVFVMLAVAVLAGCNEPSPKSRQWTAVPSSAPPAITFVAPPTSIIPPTTNVSTLVTNPAPSVVTPDAFGAAVPPAAPRAESDWVVFTTWSEENHLGIPRRLLSATNLTYELRTTNGVIALTAGSALARFNGMACFLGYVPRYSNGNFLVHGLDAKKSVLPLVGSAGVIFPVDSTVVIDPGHGGVNAGTRCIVNDQFEKDLTLDWALRLQPLLESKGWHVVLTRTNDMDVSLADRVALAENLKATLFISLHFNSSFPKQDQSGIETFCLTPVGMPSTLVRDFADDITQAFPDNAHDEQNLQLAMRVHSALVDATGAADRGVRHARFMGVLRGQKRPAILVEGGYLSNPREAALIAIPEYRQSLAEAVARALIQPYATSPQELSSGSPE